MNRQSSLGALGFGCLHTRPTVGSGFFGLDPHTRHLAGWAWLSSHTSRDLLSPESHHLALVGSFACQYNYRLSTACGASYHCHTHQAPVEGHTPLDFSGQTSLGTGCRILLRVGFGSRLLPGAGSHVNRSSLLLAGSGKCRATGNHLHEGFGSHPAWDYLEGMDMPLLCVPAVLCP